MSQNSRQAVQYQQQVLKLGEGTMYFQLKTIMADEISGSSILILDKMHGSCTIYIKTSSKQHRVWVFIS